MESDEPLGHADLWCGDRAAEAVIPAKLHERGLKGTGAFAECGRIEIGNRGRDLAEARIAEQQNRG